MVGEDLVSSEGRGANLGTGRKWEGEGEEGGPVRERGGGMEDKGLGGFKERVVPPKCEWLVLPSIYHVLHTAPSTSCIASFPHLNSQQHKNNYISILRMRKLRHRVK